MTRIINNHYVLGRAVKVVAIDEMEARVKVGYITTDPIWEIKQNRFNGNLWEAYVASPEDCYSTDE